MRVESVVEAIRKTREALRICDNTGTYPCALDHFEVETKEINGRTRVTVRYTVDNGQALEERGAIFWMGPRCPVCGGRGEILQGRWLVGCDRCGATGVLRAKSE